LVEAVATMIGCLPTQALVRLARFPSKRNASDCVWMETGLNTLQRVRALRAAPDRQTLYGAFWTESHAFGDTESITYL